MTRQSTQRLVLAIALSVAGALVAVLAGQAELALLVLPWVVLCVLGLSQPPELNLDVTTTVSKDRLMVGDEVEVTARLSSNQDLLVKVSSQPGTTFWSPHAGPDKQVAVALVDAVSAGRPTDVVRELPANEWGSHDLGRALVEATMPYGLTRYVAATTERRQILVHPTSIQIRELIAPWLVRRVSGTHASAESARGVEYADIREFAVGDSLRDINWRASARTTDLMVSQRQPDRATDVILLVDSFVESGHDVRAVFGSVVEATVALAESHLGATDRVGLIEFGGLVRWVAPRTGRVQLHRVTDAVLATGLYENAADKELPILPTRALPPRSFLIALSPLLDQRFIDAVFSARARGHDVAVVECAPDQIEPDADVLEFDRVGRRLWEAERAVYRDQMIGQGIAVGQWRPGEHLDVALGQLVRARRQSPQMRRR